MRFETKAIREQMERTHAREHSTPLYPTSSFTFEDAEHMRSTFAGETGDNVYSRFTNPNCQEFEQKMAALEGGEAAVATASGMSAIFSTFMGLLKTGDHVLLSRALFGSTYQQSINILPRYGIETSFVDPERMDEWDQKVQWNTKMLFLETPSNPGLVISDLEGANAFAKKHGLIFAVDNCFATPYLQQPITFGADLSVHSATKFIDGQGRVLGGMVVGKQEFVEDIRKFCRNTGPSLSPFNAWILSKSLETLAVRLDRHCESALAIATQLQDHPAIEQVRYPFLPNHPGYALAKKQMRHGGGLLTFELKGGLEAGRSFLDHLQMCSLTANLGDTRTIATHPASTTHAKLTSEAREEIGITDGLIRLSVGLEHIEDILKDLEYALSKVVSRVLEGNNI